MLTATSDYGRVSRHDIVCGLSSRCIIVGREGCISLGEILTKLMRAKGFAVKSLVSFDLPKMLTIYEIYVESMPVKAMTDVMVCLNDPALEYEDEIVASGTIIIDSSSVTRKPSRRDIEKIYVPATSLVHDLADQVSDESRDRFDVALSGLIGSLEAIESEYPDPELFRKVFETLEIEPVTPYLAAVYRGYDWLQECWMRGKTSWGGASR